MSKSIKTNVKKIVKNSVAIPAEAAATTLEVAADATSLATDAVRGTVPFAKQVSNTVGGFVYGLFNSNIEPVVAEKMYKNLNLDQIMTAIEQGAVKAGQDFAKSWDEDDKPVTADK